MGQCSNTQSANVVYSISDNPLKNSAVATHYDVMISYASVDQSICHQLANYLICSNFNAWFHLNPVDNEFNRVIALCYSSVKHILDFIAVRKKRFVLRIYIKEF